jgi:hypothetical protein
MTQIWLEKAPKDEHRTCCLNTARQNRPLIEVHRCVRQPKGLSEARLWEFESITKTYLKQEILNLELQTLRNKHKAVLIEHALRIFPVDGDDQKIRSYWLQRLLDGQYIQHMLAHLKAGEPIPKEQTHGYHDSMERSTVVYTGTALIKQKLPVLRAGIPEKIRIAISNHTTDTWLNNETMPISACYHWLSYSGEMFEFEGMRTPLPEPIAPNSSLELDLSVIPPDRPGRYQLQLTLLHENVCWFEERGFTANAYPVDIEWNLPVSTSRVLKEFAYWQSVLA